MKPVSEIMLGWCLTFDNVHISVCLPDGTVQVTNPNVGLYSHVFAVQDEGVSAAVKCSVSTSGAQSNITGCSQVI